MNVLRRSAVAAIVLALFLCAAAQAQVLKQIPADPFVVIKVNKPQAVSDKVAALAQKLGLANIRPELGDPLGSLKKVLNIKEGFDGSGEMALAIYEPGANENDPRVVVLIPVTDFKAFMGNFPNVQQEGNLSKFTMPDENQPVYAASWGKYAALTPSKDLLGQNPAGVSPTALSAKQLDAHDIVAWANMAKIRSVLQPMWQAVKPNVLQEMDQNLPNLPGLNPKWVPAIKALANQGIAVMEGALNDTTGVTLGLNISDAGINSAFMMEFTPESYMGKVLTGYKPASGNLLAGLPNRKYFYIVGANLDPATDAKVFSDFVDPIVASLGQAGDDAKPILTMIDSAKTSLASLNGLAMGYVQPTGQPMQQGVLQVVGVYRGNAGKIAQASRQSQGAVQQFMNMLPQAPGVTFNYTITPDAKTVDGIKLDDVSMKFNVNPNNPQAAMMGQMFQIMYGPNGWVGGAGAVDDSTYVFAMGSDDALLTEAVAAAKKHDTALEQDPGIAAASNALPKNKIAVEYLAVDNIADTVTKFMALQGARVPVQIPTGLPPIGLATTIEGPSLQVDTHISTDLIQNAVSTVIQAMAAMQRGRPGQL